MRRPLLLSVICAVGLVLVLVGQSRLKKMVEETKSEESAAGTPPDLPPELRDPGSEALPPKDTERSNLPSAEGSGDESVTAPRIDGTLELAPSEAQKKNSNASASAREQVMAALLETRQVFQNRSQVTEDTKKNPHVTSSAITQAAAKLADLADLATENPEYKDEFHAFYLECAKDDKVITVTRVQCLERFIQSKAIKGEEKKALLSTLPPAVSRLYSEIDRGP